MCFDISKSIKWLVNISSSFFFFLILNISWYTQYKEVCQLYCNIMLWIYRINFALAPLKHRAAVRWAHLNSAHGSFQEMLKADAATFFELRNKNVSHLPPLLLTVHVCCTCCCCCCCCQTQQVSWGNRWLKCLANWDWEKWGWRGG